MSYCRSCNAEIRWASTEANGKAIPLDAVPDPRGNVVLVGDNRARVLGPLEVALLDADTELFMPHHATCPDVAAFKNQRAVLTGQEPT